MMKRQIAFMMVAVGFAALIGAASAPVVCGQEIKLTYANFPPAPTFPCVQMERWTSAGSRRRTCSLPITPAVSSCCRTGG